MGSGMETSGVSDDSVPRYRCRLGPVRSLLLNPLLKLFMGGTRLAPSWSVAIECTDKGQNLHQGHCRFKYVACISHRCSGGQSGVLLRAIFNATAVHSQFSSDGMEHSWSIARMFWLFDHPRNACSTDHPFVVGIALGASTATTTPSGH